VAPAWVRAQRGRRRRSLALKNYPLSRPDGAVPWKEIAAGFPKAHSRPGLQLISRLRPKANGWIDACFGFRLLAPVARAWINPHDRFTWWLGRCRCGRRAGDFAFHKRFPLSTLLLVLVWLHCVVLLWADTNPTRSCPPANGQSLVRVDAQQLRQAWAYRAGLVPAILAANCSCDVAAARPNDMGPSAEARASARQNRSDGWDFSSCGVPSLLPLSTNSSSGSCGDEGAMPAEAFSGRRATHGTRRRTCSWP